VIILGILIGNHLPLSEENLRQLEQFLFQAGEVGTRQDFEKANGRQENLGLFIRRLVGLDRQAVKQAFVEYLDGKNFTRDQIQFISYIIDTLTQQGVMEVVLLYESPLLISTSTRWLESSPTCRQINRDHPVHQPEREF